MRILFSSLWTVHCHEMIHIIGSKVKNLFTTGEHLNTKRPSKHQILGFTLIEVLIALLMISIGLTTLLKTTGQNIQTANRLKDKSIQHLVCMSALAELQLRVHQASSNQDITRSTKIFGHTWYWRAKISATSIKRMQQITVSASPHQTGPFTNPLIGYRYQS
ncbi:MAG TPA: type II secretion system minor pseudopilin GspI [Legionellaceae bacterium]|nr:type II secretion system minor pseudopilin GspI [Legionellaceae bacterium]